ncbi:hypothetical protein [Tateyamaria sp.]|uniref:hypothetical protein n=1 Tax=Tateyamaria sp. TaxID=1929288 RepID=UPI0032A12A86
MTEKMENKETPQSVPEPYIPGARYAIDPLAFFFALVSAPVVVALLFFWMLAIPVFAVAVGGLPYLIVGTPVLLIYLHYRKGSPQGTAGCAAITVIVGCVLAITSAVIHGDLHEMDGILTFGITAAVHATAWGFAFGKLYNRWRSDLSRRPLPPYPNQHLKGPIPC